MKVIVKSCPFCSDTPTISNKGTQISIDCDCGCNFSFQKSDYFTHSQSKSETFNDRTYMFSEAAESSVLSHCLSIWNNRMFKDMESVEIEVNLT